jgi:hypothetical protein
MASLKKMAVGATVGVWMTGLGSAAALAFVLNRPLEPRTLVEPTTAHASVGHLLAEEAPVRIEHALPQPVLTVVHVVRSMPAPKPAPTHVDIEQMRCDDWRELTMGSGHVQVCQ